MKEARTRFDEFQAFHISIADRVHVAVMSPFSLLCADILNCKFRDNSSLGTDSL